MTTTDPVKARHHALWALGDYDRIAALLGDLGRDLVAAADIRTGQRVLDVAAGTGNVTYAGLGDDAEHVAALDRDLLEFAARENSGVVGGPGRYEFEYLLWWHVRHPKGGEGVTHSLQLSPACRPRPLTRSQLCREDRNQ